MNPRTRRLVIGAVLLLALVWSASACGLSVTAGVPLMIALGMHAFAGMQVAAAALRLWVMPRIDAAACFSVAAALAVPWRELTGIGWALTLLIVLGAITLSTACLIQLPPTAQNKALGAAGNS